MVNASNIINEINSILFPTLCFACDNQLFPGEKNLCTVCRNDLPFTEFNFITPNILDEAFFGLLQVEKSSSLFFYRQKGLIKNMIHNLKYKNQERISYFLGDWYGTLLKDEGLANKIDVVVPVPMHPKKLKKRGYNQVDGFAQEIAKHLKAGFEPHGLLKTGNTRTQTKKARDLRWQQQQKLYVVNNSVDLANKRILLVDDVVTTGATLTACANALLGIKGVKVYIASMAVVPKAGQ